MLGGVALRDLDLGLRLLGGVLDDDLELDLDLDLDRDLDLDADRDLDLDLDLLLDLLLLCGGGERERDLEKTDVLRAYINEPFWGNALLCSWVLLREYT